MLLYKKTSSIFLARSDLRIQLHIQSRLNRKNRRTILLTLFRHMKSAVRDLDVSYVYHSDEPLKTTVSTMLRGTVGNDALDRYASSEAELGYFIRICRTRFNLTQKELAKEVGISRCHLSKLEHGKKKPSLKMREKLLTWIEESFSEPLRLETALQTEAKRISALR